MSNLIERKAISDLLTGGYFYIPSYQRGYRWTPTQVTQLLRDLFSYANEPHGTSTTNLEGDYYCLQPVVARLMTNEKVFLTSSMRHPNQWNQIVQLKSGFMARCFSVRNNVFVKNVPFLGSFILIVVMVLAISSTWSTLISILLIDMSRSSSL